MLQDITSNQRQTYSQFPFHLGTLYGIGVTVMLGETSALDFLFFLKETYGTMEIIIPAINLRMCLSILPKF